MQKAESDGKVEFSSILESKPAASSVDHVVNSIKTLLLGRKVLPGDRLPAEIELTRLLSVSRGSVREAMKILSALGIVDVRRGDGTYIADHGGNVAFDPLLFSMIVSQPKFAELKELRLILEKNVARLAILNASESELTALRHCVENTQALSRKKEKDYAALLSYDLEFHRILGQSCRNGPLQTIYKFVMQYFESYISQSLHNQSEFSRESREAHEKILAAIELRNVAAAEQAVEDSMEVWEALVFKQ